MVTGAPPPAIADRIVPRCEAAGVTTVPYRRWSVRYGGNSELRSKAKTRPVNAGERNSLPQCRPAGAPAAGAAAGNVRCTFVQWRVSAKG